MAKENKPDVIDIGKDREKHQRVAKYLRKHSGKGISRQKIAEEIDDVDISDTLTYQAPISDGGFYHIRSKYDDGRKYYYAKFAWDKALIYTTIFLSVLLVGVLYQQGMLFTGYC